MKITKLLKILLLLAVTSARAQDKNISGYSFYDAEPFLAVNPADPQHLVAAWMKATGFSQVSIATKVSYDGGATWSAGVNLPHHSPSYTSADPSIAFNRQGETFIVYVDYKASFDSGGIYISKSANGGNTWGTPVKVTDINEKPDLPVDRPWIAIDNSGGPRDGYIYITSKSAPDVTCPCDIWLKVSSGNGSTWGPIKHLDQSIPMGPAMNAMAVPAVSKDGTFYYSYYSFDTSLNPFVRMVLGKSTDGGQTFSHSTIVSATAASSNTDSLYQGSYALSANPLDADNLIAVWTDNRNGDIDIYSAASADGGATWTNPKRVNDDAVGNGYGQDMCWGTFGSDGRYMTGWRDRRNNAGGSSASFNLYCAVSDDKGISFGPNKNLSSVPSPFINIQRGNDFIGTAIAPGTVYALWADLRDGNTEIYFRKDTIGTATGITENNPYNLLIYPNPSSENFNLSLETAVPVALSMEVYDLSGKRVKRYAERRITGGTGRISFGEELKTGEYQLKIIIGNRSYSRKIVKN